jgi:hypothetical protein
MSHEQKTLFDIPPLTTDSIESFSLSGLATMNSTTQKTVTVGSGINTNVTTSGITYNYPVIGGGGGGSGLYKVNAIPTITLGNITNGANWAPSPPPTHTQVTDNGIKIMGDADITGNLRIKGKDIAELFASIEDRLAIYQAAPEIEEKWEQLRDLARQYKETLADIKEKEQIFDILKK